MGGKLFVGGLAPGTTTERLRETFAACGTVDSAAVVTSPEGHSRGFGFVEMASIAEAEEAIRSLDRSSLDGRMIKVEWARHPPAARPARRVERKSPPAA